MLTHTLCLLHRIVVRLNGVNGKHLTQGKASDWAFSKVSCCSYYQCHHFIITIVITLEVQLGLPSHRTVLSHELTSRQEQLAKSSVLLCFTLQIDLLQSLLVWCSGRVVALVNEKMFVTSLEASSWEPSSTKTLHAHMT